MTSAKAGDSQSSGTLQAGGESALAKLSYAGVGNNYVQFALNLPLPGDAMAVGGFFRRDPANAVKPLFSFRVTDGGGETYGYFTPELCRYRGCQKEAHLKPADAAVADRRLARHSGNENAPAAET